MFKSQNWIKTLKLKTPLHFVRHDVWVLFLCSSSHRVWLSYIKRQDERHICRLTVVVSILWHCPQVEFHFLTLWTNWISHAHLFYRLQDSFIQFRTEQMEVTGMFMITSIEILKNTGTRKQHHNNDISQECFEGNQVTRRSAVLLTKPKPSLPRHTDLCHHFNSTHFCFSMTSMATHLFERSLRSYWITISSPFKACTESVNPFVICKMMTVWC